MDEGSRHIKKFKDYVSNRKYSRLLSHLIIEGKTKRSFFSKSLEFELHVYFTPVKKIIMDIHSTGVSLDDKRLNLTFKKGDAIDLVYKWVEDNEHEIIFEMLK
jgi:hypothetical protein